MSHEYAQTISRITKSQVICDIVLAAMGKITVGMAKSHAAGDYAPNALRYAAHQLLFQMHLQMVIEGKA